jgi:hypothetical protein
MDRFCMCVCAHACVCVCVCVSVCVHVCMFRVFSFFFLFCFFLFGLNWKKKKWRKKTLRGRSRNAPSVQMAATAFVIKRFLYPQTSSFNISVKTKVVESWEPKCQGSWKLLSYMCLCLLYCNFLLKTSVLHPKYGWGGILTVKWVKQSKEDRRGASWYEGAATMCGPNATFVF